MDYLVKQADINLRHIPYKHVIGTVVSPETRSATTIDTLSSSIRFWLYTKGFKKDEDIIRLQERGSSLAEALLMLMTLLPYRPAHIAGSSQKKTIIPSLTKGRGILKETSLSIALMQVSSEGPLEDSTIEAAKEVRVRRILDAEVQLAEDPDSVLEMAEEQLNETDDTPLHALIQSSSRIPGDSSTRDTISEPIFKTRIQLLNGGRYYNGCRRQNLKVDIYLPMNIICYNKSRKVLDSDAGARLAIAATREEGGRFITVYTTNHGFWAPYKANTFVDWLNGIGYVQICRTPRRYLHFQPQLLEGLPEELKYFVNGGCTDDKGVKFKNEFERESSRRQR
ncbi:hypothetical protein BDV38DRAFT_291391 [Aspergillus pseudotamarii]|uniref:Uncharacterized protein n=1 Tax=Aspergillus pseudotamarii TaxID=132259 RepID=A0A5N6T105_ASPPS|nr:uncharacterized protein BDV38DRAFT_291391 [Aspergillus pseudotamarii]KAE8139324.1 hypothetical protein BDV38DRAFT_291391 [Aspergillus pseudotamarii]